MKYIYISILALFTCFVTSCEGPDEDSNWRERDDLVTATGQKITGEQAEKAGLVIYNILQFILRKESHDTLLVVDSALPWEEIKAHEFHLEILKEIKEGHTFSKRNTAFESKNAYPTMYYDLGTFAPNKKEVSRYSTYWILKNHEYDFQDASGQEVPIAFFSKPKTIRIRNVSTYQEVLGEMTRSTNYFAELQYKPKDATQESAKGKVSFDIFAKTGYDKIEIDKETPKGRLKLKDREIKLVDFSKDFAVLDLGKDFPYPIDVAGIAKDGNRYKTKPIKKFSGLYGGKTGKLGVNKIVWDYVISQDYKLEKEAFLQWFANKILMKTSTFSQEEKEAQYVVCYSIGDADKMIIYSPIEEKLEAFQMSL